MADTIKKGKYRVYNGSGYDTIHLQTTAEQVIESNEKQFVSQTEKNTWGNKAEKVHTHDDRYYKKDEVYTADQMDVFLNEKSDKTHGHSASEITETTTKKFVTPDEKSRWDDKYTKQEVNTAISSIVSTITDNEENNVSEHARIEREYKVADTAIKNTVTELDSKVDKAIEDLTDLINNGGEANSELAEKVARIESVDLPKIKNDITNLSSRVDEEITDLKDSKVNVTDYNDDLSLVNSKLSGLETNKANKSDVTASLALKADKADTYTKAQTDAIVSPKADKTYVDDELAKKANSTTVTTELNKKVDKITYNAEMPLKADKSWTEGRLDEKTDIGHKHLLSDITNAGTAASKNIGTNAGQVPMLDQHGKLDTSILPSMAINEKFTAANEQDAMLLDMEIGDILLLDPSFAAAIYEKLIEESKDSNKESKIATIHTELSNEYQTYLASGRITFLCVDDTASVFEDKFKPLQSSADTVSKAEIDAALAKKVDKLIYDTDKKTLEDAIDTKADASQVYTKVESNDLLATKVDKVTGKGLSTNDYTNAEKDKLAGIEEGANLYIHPNDDGELHVPATGTANNGKVLMAGSFAGALNWRALNADNVSETSEKKWLTNDLIEKWNNMAHADHDHDDVYRKLSDSYNKTTVDQNIAKMATIVSTSTPAAGSQAIGAVWIEELQ